MPRDGAIARERLRAAALDLYAQQGYEATTTAQIAERAGLTERTYFRHFPDKREVLFSGEDELTRVLVDTVAGAPEDVDPLSAVRSALVASVPLFVRGRRIAVLRAPIIQANPPLRERAHAKTAALAEALARALEDRRVAPATARLVAQVGMAAFGRANADWSGASGPELEQRIDDAFAELRSLNQTS